MIRQSQPTLSPKVESVATKRIPVHVPIAPVGFGYALRQIQTGIPLLLSDALAVFVTTFAVQFCLASFAVWTPLSIAGFFTIAIVSSFLMIGMYPAIAMHPANELRHGFIVVSAVAFCFLVAGAESWYCVVAIWAANSATVATFRSLARTFFARFDWWTQPVIFVGHDPTIDSLACDMDRHRNAGLRPMGYVGDIHAHWESHDNGNVEFLCSTDELAAFAQKKHIYWAMILNENPVDEIGESYSKRNVTLAPGTALPPYGTIPNRLFLAGSEGFVPKIWDKVVFVNRTAFYLQTDRLLLPLSRFAKSVSDFVLTSLILLLSLPIVLSLAAAIKLSSAGPIFYRSQRVGRTGRVFRMTKFRTMKPNAEQLLSEYLEHHPELREEWETEQKLRNDPRINWIGRILRRLSLDELPQILDVLRGKMSLVGPRPMLLDEPEKYGADFLFYCRMLPGITGLWQVSGRNDIPHHERVKLVTYYVQNWSPWLDIYILAKTLKAVLTGKGAY